MVPLIASFLKLRIFKGHGQPLPVNAITSCGNKTCTVYQYSIVISALVQKGMANKELVLDFIIILLFLLYYFRMSNAT